MRKILFAVIALSAIPALSPSPAAAADRRFCIQENSREGVGPLQCYYDSFAQCQATASGQPAACVENPVYQSQNQYRGPARTPYRSAY